MKKIKLTNGKHALVDNRDFEYLNQYKWHLSTHGYVMRCVPPVKNGVIVYMHQQVNETPEGFDTDHINRNKLDNRKSNLRTATKMVNGRNRLKNKNNTSGVKGVSWNKKLNKWEAFLWINYKKKFLGYFSDIKEAKNARKQGEILYWI